MRLPSPPLPRRTTSASPSTAASRVPPKPLDATQDRAFGLVRDCGAALGLDIAWRATGGVCDGNNLAATGLAVVDTMGVRGDAIHSADEFVLVDSFVERARLSALVLLRVAATGFPRA